MEIVKQFGNCAKAYETYRPYYPEELYAWLSSINSDAQLALDCGTGNGQAATALAQHFDQVIAVDVNYNQLKHCRKKDNVTYLCSSAEHLCIADNSIDLIISASAAHWFNLEKFYHESKRLLKPNGNIVLWTYTWPEAEDTDINTTLVDIKNSMANYWPQSSRYHLEKYQNLPFPFQQIGSPCYCLETHWNIEALINFLNTWASIRNYIAEKDAHFLTQTEKVLRACWPSNHKIKFKFPLYIKAGAM